MSRITLSLIFGLLMSLSAFAQDLALESFNQRFKIVKNEEGRITAIKLKKAVTRFSVAPFIQQLKHDLMSEQASFNALSDYEKEAEIDALLLDMGVDPTLKSAQEESRRLKEALLNVKNIDINAAFNELTRGGFWKEFEAKLNEAFLFIDPTVLANLEDSRFFYKRLVTYKVVTWALDQAKKRFSNVPILNIASHVIIRIHDMMLEQRHFHHNMLLHYFETIPETKLGMSKEEVDRTVSSIYEYRIEVANLPESNRASNDWLNYGMNNFYIQVRAANSRINSWQGAFSNVNFENVKKLNYAFAEVTESGARKIYHLHQNVHSFSSKPALAYDFSNVKKVKRQRALLNIGGLALGFLRLPDWIKGNVDTFIKSFYVQQVRMEGALVAHFETTGNAEMIRRIYSQRSNFYIVE